MDKAWEDFFNKMELVPLSNFRTTIKFPIDKEDRTFSIYLDGFFIKPLAEQKRCDCSIKTLMETGCQCGGC